LNELNWQEKKEGTIVLLETARGSGTFTLSPDMWHLYRNFPEAFDSWAQGLARQPHSNLKSHGQIE
jgi:hypothetical protein